MLVELILRELPNLDGVGFEKLELPNGFILANPLEKRAEVIVKKHPDGRISVFTDKMEIIKKLAQTGNVIDLHVK